MPVLAYPEHNEGKFRKSALELVSYAKAVSVCLATELVVLVIGAVEPDQLQSLTGYGADKLLTLKGAVPGFTNKAYASLIAGAAMETGAELIILSNSFTGKGLGPRIAVKLEAGFVPGTAELPRIMDGKFFIRTKSFSGKAISDTEMLTPRKVITLNPNAYPVTATTGAGVLVELSSPPAEAGNLEELIKEIVKATGKVTLPEAEIIVSAGRGLKGPEHWGMIEELAGLLGAATACSKPVSDAGWRPHEEHVGQTGITVSPKLYIAIGISGAIQHLAGVSSSKTIVVINKDPEAPFFKVADYGIVGDAFDVVPRLITALKVYKENT